MICVFKTGIKCIFIAHSTQRYHRSADLDTLFHIIYVNSTEQSLSDALVFFRYLILTQLVCNKPELHSVKSVHSTFLRERLLKKQCHLAKKLVTEGESLLDVEFLHIGNTQDHNIAFLLHLYHRVKVVEKSISVAEHCQRISVLKKSFIDHDTADKFRCTGIIIYHRSDESEQNITSILDTHTICQVIKLRSRSEKFRHRVLVSLPVLRMHIVRPIIRTVRYVLSRKTY